MMKRALLFLLALLAVGGLEAEKARVEKWDGKYSIYFMGAGNGAPNLLFHLPTPGESPVNL